MTPNRPWWQNPLIGFLLFILPALACGSDTSTSPQRTSSYAADEVRSTSSGNTSRSSSSSSESDDALGTATVSVEVANIRSGPSLDAEVVEQAVKGRQFVVSARSEDQEWLQISQKGTMWVAASVVTFAPAGEPVAKIPGLSRASLQSGLEQHGLACGDVELGELYYSQLCSFDSSTYSWNVIVYGSTRESVDFIVSGAGSSGVANDPVAFDLFNQVIASSFSEPEASMAKEWIGQTLPTITTEGDERENQFGGVSFRLFGPPGVRWLQIGTLE